ncbi:GTP-binding domain protein [Dictyocaulus viviparus]|uniref:small monomeric GTPase n=1 Tax=Dictyocaulus viviparus TaxID=29172 RepID=A0A0D8XPB6_DICVI|nr:GTP-binding domain protein [Dictyocaulus viviparus]
MVGSLAEDIQLGPGPSSPHSLFGRNWQERKAYIRPSDSLIVMLTERERGYSRNGGSTVCVRHVRNQREFYSAVAMDRIVEVSERHHMQDHVISWTPDGKRLITFRMHLRAVRILRYLGVESARDSNPENLCQRLFETESEVMMMMGTSRLESASLRTDCILFTDDGKYMIVATTAPAPDQLLTLSVAYPNTEALPVTNYSLEIFTFFTINIEKGFIAHFVMYNFDRINLTHGVGLCGPTMMVMSLQKQIIHVLHVSEEGVMIPLKDIGTSIWDDDSLYLFGDSQSTPTNTSLYTGLKQRLLTFMYKEAKRDENVDEFLCLMPSYVEKLRMHRAQLFDGHYLLYGPKLLGFYENFVEVLLTPTQNPHRYPKSFQYNPHSKQRAHWLIGTISEGMYRRVLSVLPFCGCHHSSSENPFLDPLYFSIDEKIHSNLMYGRMRFDLGPVKIFARRTHHHVCSLSLPSALVSKGPACVILFHPHDPLAIAFDRFDFALNGMRSTTALREMHVALVGMAGSGKSAIAVKYITKRFIGEYDSTLEDTYCRQDTVAGQPLMVWIMDTVDDAARDEMRWLAWADVYLVIYDVTSQLSLQYAENILERITKHEHLLCTREHKTILLGNKSDLERYRQVSEAEGEAMANKYKIHFAESTATGDPRPLSQLLHTTFQNILTGTRSPSPRLCSSDSEIVTPRKSAFSALRASSRVRAKPAKPVQLHKTPSLSKIKTGSKLLKLFHN